MSLYRKEIYLKRNSWGSSLMVQWLRLHTPNARGPGSIPGQGIWPQMCNSSAHMLQWRSEILHVATGTWCSRINFFLIKKKRNSWELCNIERKKKWMCHWWNIPCAEPVLDTYDTMEHQFSCLFLYSDKPLNSKNSYHIDFCITSTHADFCRA